MAEKEFLLRDKNFVHLTHTEETQNQFHSPVSFKL